MQHVEWTYSVDIWLRRTNDGDLSKRITIGVNSIDSQCNLSWGRWDGANEPLGEGFFNVNSNPLVFGVAHRSHACRLVMHFESSVKIKENNMDMTFQLKIRWPPCVRNMKTFWSLQKQMEINTEERKRTHSPLQ